jgi:hypothetical protein
MSESLGEMVVAITGNTDDFNLSIDQAGKKFDSLTTIISQSTSDMARSFKNIDNEAKLWGESTDLIKQKQQALKNEMTSLMQQGFDPLSPKVQSLKTQYSALENETKALGKENVTLKSSMQEIDGMMGGFGSKIGALLTNPYVLAAAAIIGTIKTFTDFTKELVEYSANIKETSEKTGVSTKALQEWKYVAEQTGGSLDTITASIKMMTRGLDTNADTYKKLGIQIKDSNGEFRSSTDIFDETVKALGDLTNDTERTKLALQLFGRGALDMVPLLKEGSAGIEELKQKANDLGLVLSDKAISGAHDLEKATDSLKSSWKSFTMQLVQDSIPALTTIVNRLNEVATVSHLTGVVEENNKIIASYIYLRDDVIKYHDALESNLEIAKRDVASTYTTQSVKEAAAKKIIELTESLQYVQSEYSRQKKIDDDAQAKAAAKAAADNTAIKKIQDEADKVQALKDERQKATDAYNTELDKINLKISQGWNDEKAINEAKKKASETYLGSLNDIIIKYDLTSKANIASGHKTVDMANEQNTVIDNLTNTIDNETSAEEQAKKAIKDKEEAEKAETTQLLADIEASKKQTDEILSANASIDKQISKYDILIAKLNDKTNKTTDSIEVEKQAAIDEVNNSNATEAEKQAAIDKINEYYALLKDKTAYDTQKKNAEQTFKTVLSEISSLMSKFGDIYNQDVKNKEDAIAAKLKLEEDAIDTELAAEKKAYEAEQTLDEKNLTAAEKTIDAELQAKLKALGLADKTTIEKDQDTLASAIATGDAVAIKEAQDQLTKDTLEQEAADKKAALEDAATAKAEADAAAEQKREDDAAAAKLALEKQAAQDTYEVQLAAFKTDQDLAYANALIGAAQSIVQCYAELGPIAGSVAAAIVAGLTAYQISVIANEQPPAAPALAEGGIVMPRSGGVGVTVAEAGQAEAIFPLDKLNQFINTGTTTGSDSTTPINMTIQLDSKVLYSGVFQATKNRQILISAGAVV